jgi:hypothetical protein
MEFFHGGMNGFAKTKHFSNGWAKSVAFAKLEVLGTPQEVPHLRKARGHYRLVNAATWRVLLQTCGQTIGDFKQLRMR